ncbi:unnamed protein product [Meloidogyne enterolobii]|uniref:Uncharacterized protein n=1 Tax=Meloidogyne enterolobii TaxID=390850 RepID=A0ACB0XPK1_MELEN
MFIIPPPSTNNCVTTAQIMVAAAAAAATFGTFPSQSSFADLFGNLNNNLNLQQNILGSEDDGDNLNINNEQQTFQQQLNNVLNAVSTKHVFNKFGLDFTKENDGEQQQYLNLTPTIFNLPSFYSSNNDLNNFKNDQEFNSSFSSSTPHQHILTEPELIKNKEKSEPSIIKTTTNNFKKQKRSQSVNTTINYLNKEEKINKTINENNKERILIKQRGKIKESSINVSLNLNGIIYRGILFACFNKNNLELNEKDDWEFLIKDENN